MNEIQGTDSTEEEEVKNFFSELFGTSELKNDTTRIHHGIFKWSVENIFDFPKFQPTIFCESASFMLKKTWWVIKLCPKDKVEGIECISMQLQRHEDDPGPEDVFASYRLGLENSSNKVWFQTLFCTFPKGYSIIFQTSVLGSLEDFFSDVEDNRNVLSVLCEIYVSEASNEGNRVYEIPGIDEYLSTNMNEILDNQKGVDVSIKIRNQFIKAHKCILSARSKILSRQIENGISTIYLSCNYECLQSILRYIYSGSFDYLAKNRIFSIGLYEIAFDLSLYSLSDILIPHKIFKYTKINVHSSNTILTIPVHTPQSPNENCVYLDKNLGVRLHVIIRNIVISSSDNVVCIKLQIIGIPIGFYRKIEVYLLNRNREATERYFNPDDCLEWGVTRCFFFTMKFEDFLINTCTDGTITAVITSAVFSQRYMTDIMELPSYFQKPFRPIVAQSFQEMSDDSLSIRQNFGIKELSQDLKKLLESKSLSDFTLIADTERFGTHSCILVARSKFFNLNFYNFMCKNSRFRIRSKPRAVQLMLTYIYCGTLRHMHDLNANDFVELYDLSRGLGIPSLIVTSVILLYMTVGPLIAPLLLRKFKPD